MFGFVRRARQARRSASLGVKLVLILTSVGLVGSLSIALLLAAIITPSFGRLEHASAGEQVDSTRAVVDDFARLVETTVRDYGDWDFSYAHMAAPTPAFEDANFSPATMRGLDISGMAYVARDGQVVGARWFDVKTGMPLPDMRSRLAASVPDMDLPGLLKQDSSARFYARIGSQLVAIGVAQVRRSNGTGTPRGYVVMARTLDPAQLTRLLHMPARLRLDSAPIDTVIVADDDTMHITVPVDGADGQPVASVNFDVPRDLSWLGTRVLLLAVAGAVVLLVLMLVVLRRAVNLLVLRPLNRVEHHMGVVRQSGAFQPLSDDRRDDEIGSLVGSFNAMLRQLKDLREQVEMQSFNLGKTESAVAVMHNVRNALNPISTILTRQLGQRNDTDRAMLDRAIAELAGDDIPLARRQKLAAFVAAAAEADAAAREEHRTSMMLGRTALHSVLEIIGRQQQEAHEKPALTPCDLSDIVAQNAIIARYSNEVSIAFVFPSKQHWALANHVILSQVIGNLFSNAAEAISARGGEGGAITVSILEHDATVELTIRDDGEGFAVGSEPQLFQRGFSTRPHKSGGLGLHWCANSMVAMGGALRLESDGPGLGAQAVLTLPAVPAEALAA